MGHAPDPQTAKLQKANWDAFIGWTKSHGNMVMPIPHRAVIYAAFPPGDLMKVRNFMMAESQLRGMWQIIEEVEKQIRDVPGQVTYDKLSDVLKRLKSPLPKLRETHGANIGAPKKYSDMLSCANAMTSKDWQLVDKGKFNAVWQELSGLYVQNSQGDVEIWEGRKKNYKRIDMGSVLINRELGELLKKGDLPTKTLQAAIKLAKHYTTYYDKQKKNADDLVRQAEARLKASAKV